MSERENTAYHEAAHAVAHVFVDRPFLEVTIVPDEKNDYQGRVKALGWESDEEFYEMLDDEAQVRNEIFILLTGGAIDTLRGCFDKDTIIGLGGDYGTAADLALQYSNYQTILDEEGARANQFVRDPVQYERIERVALALLKQERLT